MTIIKYPEPSSLKEKRSSKVFHIIGRTSADPMLLPPHQGVQDITANKKNAIISMRKNIKFGVYFS